MLSFVEFFPTMRYPRKNIITKWYHTSRNKN